MSDRNIINIFKEKYPHLAKKITMTYLDGTLTGTISFHNPRYQLWFTQENKTSYIVGINFLHSHFDCGDDGEENLADALAQIDAILQDEIVAIGKRNKTENYIIATMSKEDGLRRYANGNSNIEIVSFSQEY
jgi:hypothetical protein